MSKVSDKSFHKGVYGRKSLLDIPTVVQKYFDKHDLVGYWLDNNSVTKFGGHDPRGYKVFKVPAELEEIKKETESDWDADFMVSSDGTIRRESMILGYMPRRIRTSIMEQKKQENKLSRNTIDRVARERGVSVEQAEIGAKQALRRKPSASDITD